MAVCCALLLCASIAHAKVRTQKAKSGHRTGTSTSATARSATAKSATAKSSRARRSAASTAKSAAQSKTSKRASAKAVRRDTKVVRARGQQAIDGDRVREIQGALIRAKYLDGEPSGIWDSETRSAMTRFQSDNGWQSKVVPDSRALIKLGLGPNHDSVINPETSGINATPAVAVSPATGLQNGGGIAQ